MAKIENVPMMLIDDEATKINALIRQLLGIFKQR